MERVQGRAGAEPGELGGCVGVAQPDLLGAAVGVADQAGDMLAGGEPGQVQQAQPVVGGQPLVVGRIIEGERQQALLLEVALVDAGQAAGDHRRAAQQPRRQGGVLAAAAFAVVPVTDDDPAQAGGPVGPRDAAVIASPVRSPQVRAVPILDDPLCLVCPPGTPAAPVRLADLQGSTLLLLAAGTGLHEQIETALREHGVAAHLVEYPTAETIKTAVGLGMGSTILPASAFGVELASARLSARPIADWTAACRVVRLLVRAEGRPPAPVAAFTRLLQQHYSTTRS